MSEDSILVEELTAQWICLKCKKVQPLHRWLSFISEYKPCKCGFKSKIVNNKSQILNKNREMNE